MSASAESSVSSSGNAPLQAQLSIDFVVVGGGIAGLACALALRRVGHNVQVLERASYDGARGSGGVRVPPNLSKIFFHWGLRDALLRTAIVTTKLDFGRYESGENLGQHAWDEQLLKESRGSYLILSHADLYDVLFDAAVARGARVRHGCAVAGISAEGGAVTLAGGEVLRADVVVGADGEHGLARKEEYLFTAFGSGHAIIAYPMTGKIAIQVYAPDDGRAGHFGDEPCVDLSGIADGIGEIFKPAIACARKAIGPIPIKDHTDLEDWVSEDGALVLIGEAAHPFPPSTIQGTAMAVEDGAVLAKLFSHLSCPRQIRSFLHAFQELRQARVRAVRAGELQATFFMTADGPDALIRDAAMRAKAAAGRNVLDADAAKHGAEEEAVRGAAEAAAAAAAKWEEYRIVFGYDCEDEADDWWVQWGLLGERAREGTSEASDSEEGAGSGSGARRAPAPRIDFASAMTSVQVVEHSSSS
ncbi:FAD/NAD(P)-binding domain-containing protein [Epithele typhae]|uniref:FAD/NAD(P)-binding domain-containing protein n=1 Tax=Epithele typhae TaxID=378194 RepID=UPI0020089BB8|nr:FAD/NAD(P)-binding domain-containing protein [Epithele typhae]KAH9933243.1 FAD/NAD(P)-binding domain-containing protein [Epithele typhae]